MSVLQTTSPEATLPVEEVVGLHDYVMGNIRQQQVLRGRRVIELDDPRAYKFCMLNMSPDLPSDDTGSVDTYFSLKLAKPGPRNWSMLVSFLDGTNTTAEATSNSRTIYRIDWTRTLAIGITWKRMAIGNAASNVLLRDMNQEQVEAALLSSQVVRQESEPAYMSVEDVDVIRQRAQGVAEAVLQSTPHPRTILSSI